MTLQEQIVEAWRRETTAFHTDEYVADNLNFAIGLLTGAGFPGAAMFVLRLGQDKLGSKQPDVVELRRKLGLM